MSAFDYITGLLGLNDSNEADGLDILANLLSEREAVMTLDAQYEKPTTNTMGEPTAVFPISLFQEGEEYGAASKEFPLPDSGLDDADAALTQFVADANGIDADDVTFADLAAVQGLTASAELNDEGDIEVAVPSQE